MAKQALNLTLMILLPRVSVLVIIYQTHPKSRPNGSNNRVKDYGC